MYDVTNLEIYDIKDISSDACFDYLDKMKSKLITYAISKFIVRRKLKKKCEEIN